MILQKLLKRKTVKNAGYLIAGKVIQMAFSFVIGLLTARYLGPSNYGLMNYAGAYTAFFAAICTLGINNVLVKEFMGRTRPVRICILRRSTNTIWIPRRKNWMRTARRRTSCSIWRG